MNIYECRRYKDFEFSWRGALLIAAPDEETARKIYVEEHYANEEPEEIDVLVDITATGKPRIIYNDELR